MAFFKIALFYLSIIICLHTVICYQVFYSNTNNLHTVVWFQTYLSNNLYAIIKYK